MTLLRVIPLWAWAVLGIVVVLGIQEYRVQAALSASAAARDAMFSNARQAIDAQQVTTEQERAAFARERAALKDEIGRAAQALAALEGHSRVAGEATARDRDAAKRLVDSPTCDALRDAGRRLGVVTTCR